MSEDLFLSANAAYASLYDLNGDSVTIFNHDRRTEENPDPFDAGEPDMTGVCE